MAMIYLVEDDAGIRELVRYTLDASGFEVKGFADAQAFYEALHGGLPQVILLDIMLPGEDGIAILKKLRARKDTSHIPIMMLTAKSTEFDKVLGLDLGADDYLTKPFGMMELLSRIKALLRRVGQQGGGQSDVIQVGNITINTAKHTVEVDGLPVELTLKEYNILQELAQSPGMVFTREQLLQKIWGYEFEGETRTVDVHIRTLRSKLGSGGDVLETIRGVGYKVKERA